jgi:hypothetical protein
MVDMEASTLIAVANYRTLRLAHLLYAGDMVAGETWDSRSWSHARTIREHLFRLAASAALRLHELP